VSRHNAVSRIPRLTDLEGQHTCVQNYPRNKRQPSTHCTESRKCVRCSQNAHRKVDLEKDNRGSLPADSPELDTIDVPLEDFQRLKVKGFDCIGLVRRGYRHPLDVMVVFWTTLNLRRSLWSHFCVQRQWGPLATSTLWFGEYWESVKI
jgi:hypothetical protein